MIWDETASPAIIVMLTQTHESGREKCFPYFPLEPSSPTLAINEINEFGDDFIATLTLDSITEDARVRSTIRHMTLLDHRTNTTKPVIHMLFAGWPDFFVPEGADRTALISLVRLSQELNADHPESPLVVHCSAGVGRTGTFIALDWLLTELDNGALDHVAEAADPVNDLVDMLRQQRMMMVQGDAQFSFLYDVLQEAWLGRWEARQAQAQSQS
jgi:protein-tyrosine phosphatase